MGLGNIRRDCGSVTKAVFGGMSTPKFVKYLLSADKRGKAVEEDDIPLYDRVNVAIYEANGRSDIHNETGRRLSAEGRAMSRDWANDLSLARELIRENDGIVRTLYTGVKDDNTLRSLLSYAVREGGSSDRRAAEKLLKEGWDYRPVTPLGNFEQMQIHRTKDLIRSRDAKRTSY